MQLQTLTNDYINCTHMTILALSSPFSHFEASSASSILPLVNNQTGDSGITATPRMAKKGTMEQMYAKICQGVKVPIK